MTLIPNNAKINRSLVENPDGTTSQQVIVTGGIGSSNANISIGVATEPISAVQVIRADVGNGVAIAEPDTFDNANAIGITITAAPLAGDVKYITSGELHDSSLFFTEGVPLYLSSNGGITDIPPVTGFLLLLGTAITNGISVNIQQPIEL